ncbi:hypothetical protein NQ317_002899 [Molorchus minor]|uniref:Uncharacterized protein n=1 Tax=Molorchus minor TaxID=1323400 RepID=A0ABQ9JIN9_9CUCU|nr:hypothetical protein NQ317_002899 [Molorchus minor]
MDEITRTETQHHINCILHEAEMKKLHEKYNIEPAAAVNVEYDEPSSPRDCDAESNQVVCDSGYTINIKTDNSVS